MYSQPIETIAYLRLTVAFLGERGQNGWWQSSFFGSGSKAFLTPVFPRTELLAQYHGVCTAAARIHDERIGVGDVYHLFRLPADLEQDVHRYVGTENASAAVFESLADSTHSLEILKRAAAPVPPGAIGPVQIGDRDSIRDLQTWAAVAGYYASAFDQGIQIYPFFSGN